MDLLRHYDDLSSSSDEESKTKGHLSDEMSSTSSSSPGKRRKRLQNEMSLAVKELASAGTGSSKRSFKSPHISERIKLLSAYQQLDLSANERNFFVRNDPHVMGNWCGHIYISLQQNNDDPYQILRDLARTAIQRFHKDLLTKEQLQKESITIVPFLNMRDELDLSSDDEISIDSENQEESDEPSLHISLSRHFYLQHQSIQPFIRDLKSHLASIPLLNVSTSSTATNILTNDDCTRSFLSLELARKEHGKAYSQICRLIRVVDVVLEKYGCKSYYQNPSIHVSVASWRYNKALIDTVGSQCGSHSLDDDNSGCVFRISSVQCDFGANERHMIPLLGNIE